MQKTKVASRKSKTVTVVYFGSDDLSDMPTDSAYKAMQNQLTIYQPADLRALPSTLAGNKVVKLTVETVVMIEGEQWGFVFTKSKRAKGQIENDTFIKRAMTQLEMSLLNGQPRFVLVPYYCKLAKKAKG